MSLKSSFRLQGEEAKHGGSADLAEPAGQQTSHSSHCRWDGATGWCCCISGANGEDSSRNRTQTRQPKLRGASGEALGQSQVKRLQICNREWTPGALAVGLRLQVRASATKIPVRSLLAFRA